MASGLDDLVKNTIKDSYKNISKFYKGKELRKRVFPYDWFDNFKKLKETKLPPIMYFYLKLEDKYISKEDYKHAKQVWETFEMKTMEDYHDLYLKSDVLLLADVFENFRDVCMNNYKLDPAFYYTAFGLAWDASV